MDQGSTTRQLARCEVVGGPLGGCVVFRSSAVGVWHVESRNFQIQLVFYPEYRKGSGSCEGSTWIVRTYVHERRMFCSLESGAIPAAHDVISCMLSPAMVLGSSR